MELEIFPQQLSTRVRERKKATRLVYVFRTRVFRLCSRDVPSCSALRCVRVAYKYLAFVLVTNRKRRGEITSSSNNSPAQGQCSKARPVLQARKVGTFRPVASSTNAHIILQRLYLPSRQCQYSPAHTIPHKWPSYAKNLSFEMAIKTQMH